MNFKKILNYVSIALGIIVTLLMLIVFVPKFGGLIADEGISYLFEVPKAFANWYDDPTAFFITYFIGYAIIWWKPIWGSVIILLGDILLFAFNSQNMGIFIFIIPTMLVAVFYILYWIEKNKESKTKHNRVDG
jgi:hypothetical protein